jgi:peptidylprolyl isomerase domain and WD repeat-containing protein 1
MEQNQSMSIYTKNLPQSTLYEKSYMHLEPLKQIITHPSQNLISTISSDGILKLWTKKSLLIEFCKKFKVMNGSLGKVKMSPCGNYEVILSQEEQCFRVLDLVSKEIINFIKLQEKCTNFSFIKAGNNVGFNIIFWADSTKEMKLLNVKNQKINLLFERKGSNKILFLDYWVKGGCWVIIDDCFHIDIIDSKTNKMVSKKLNDQVKFGSKFDTDLFQMRSNLKTDQGFLSGKLLQKKSQFCVLTSKSNFIVMDLASAKIMKFINIDKISMEYLDSVTKDDENDLKKPKNEIESNPAEWIPGMINKMKLNSYNEDFFQNFKFDVDKFEKICIIPSKIGIIYLNISQEKIEKMVAREEKSLHLIGVSLFQGKEQRREKGSMGKGGQSSQEKIYDPCLFCWAFKKNRFYIFSNREPIQILKEESKRQKGFAGRDQMNEVVQKERFKVVKKNEKVAKRAKKVMISTSMGDIFLKLFPEVGLWFFLIKCFYFLFIIKILLFHLLYIPS